MEFQDWDLVDYRRAVQRQNQLVDAVTVTGIETVVFCRHSPVVTLGRASQPDDVAGWKGPLVETNRGGRATYHGPGQIVIYPILDLRVDHADFPAKDLHAYMRTLEKIVVGGLNEIGLKAEARTTKIDDLSLTGVWVGEKKIASIGIAVRKWVTMHGVAINVEKDELAFRGIQACGFQNTIMTSVEDLLGQAPREELKAALKSQMEHLF